MADAMAGRTYLPEAGPGSDIDSEFQEMLLKLAGDALGEGGGARPMLVLGDRKVDLPEQYAQILMQAAEAMRRGRAITIVPQESVLSTQEAADFLGVSRPTIIRMLEAGKISFTKINRHRRIYLADLVAYQERHRRIADEALSDMVADAQMMGDYDDDFAEAQETLARIRKGG